MENFFSFGKTKEEKQARKMALEEANKKQAQLREAYKKAEDGFKNREKELKAARERHRTKEATKEMRQEKKRQQTKEATKEMKKEGERRRWQKEERPGAGPAKGRR